MTTRRRREPDASELFEASDVGASEKITMLIYGHPGVGKTRFIGTAPHPKRTLIIRPPTDHTASIKGSGIKEVVVRTWTRMFEVMETLRDSNGAGLDWVWLDSISLFQDTGLDDIWSGVIAEKPARARYGLDKQEYGINMFRLGQFIRHIVGADIVNFGITAHPAELDHPEDEERMGTILMPWIQGKNMAPKICGYMHFVGYMTHERVNGKARTALRAHLTENWYGKDQYHALQGKRMLDPTIPKLLDRIQGGQ